jgi:diaminopimelate decarboxylase
MPTTNPSLKYAKNDLTFDGVLLADLAREHGTPLYVYSAETVRRNFSRVQKAFRDASIAYSVKANSTAVLLRLLHAEGASFDIVSGGELFRVRRAGIPADRVIFAGVGKTADEMRYALKEGVREFNVESPSEAVRLNEVALSMKKVAPVAMRVNPDVDAKTHEKIATGKKENKFGISLAAAKVLAREMRDMPGLRLDGIHAHIGSQILHTEPHAQAVAVLDRFLNELREEGHELRTLNFGGGFGISYSPGQQPLDLKPVAAVVTGLAKKHKLDLILEPGRSIIGPAGLLLTRVEYIKSGEAKTFVIVDASMNEVIRPTLYSAHHEIIPLVKGRGATMAVDIVGPVCETGDFLARDREVRLPAEGDLLAVLDTGAYCSVMASNYNSRPRCAEVLIDNGQVTVIRKRETWKDLVRAEV